MTINGQKPKQKNETKETKLNGAYHNNQSYRIFKLYFSRQRNETKFRGQCLIACYKKIFSIELCNKYLF